MAMIIARPTAASAAATTITKKTKICPETACQWCANATNVRFTAFSINSIDMKIEMTLRLMRKAPMPIENRIAARMRYAEIGTSAFILARLRFRKYWIVNPTCSAQQLTPTS